MKKETDEKRPEKTTVKVPVSKDAIELLQQYIQNTFPLDDKIPLLREVAKKFRPTSEIKRKDRIQYAILKDIPSEYKAFFSPQEIVLYEALKVVGPATIPEIMEQIQSTGYQPKGDLLSIVQFRLTSLDKKGIIKKNKPEKQ